MRIVEPAGLGVGIGQSLGHLGLVGIGPGHQEDRLESLGTRGGAVPGGIVKKDRPQGWIDRALAAVHQHDRIELAARRIETHLVVADKAVTADHVGAQVGVEVMPVEA